MDAGPADPKENHMLMIRKASERGHFNHGWLDTWHTFSFADYYDPRFMGFRHLRVINEDTVAPGEGFPTHPHRDMEILTYILDGALEHKDSMGTGSVIRPGEVQRMSAGTGVTHSEFNASDKKPVHLLQIWLLPEKNRLPPSYEQKAVPAATLNGKLALIASREGGPGGVAIHQDVKLYASKLGVGKRVSHAIASRRHTWLQIVRGEIEANGQVLSAGDGAALSDEATLDLEARGPSEVLLFDLA
jgi:redox-sensitive bicupin YhaK (pirin superfamily)